MFTDIHHHLVYGIDDAARSFSESCAMLKNAKKDGISTLFATAHMEPGYKKFPMKEYCSNFARLHIWRCENGIDIQLLPGVEVLYTEHMIRMLGENQVPTLGDSKCILIEFYSDVTLNRLISVAEDVVSLGYQPIYAHVERYDCLRSIDNVRVLREEELVWLQMNCRTALESTKTFHGRWARDMLCSDYIDFIATDSHNLVDRVPRMKKCWQVLSALLGEKRTRKLMRENQQRIISG